MGMKLTTAAPDGTPSLRPALSDFTMIPAVALAGFPLSPSKLLVSKQRARLRQPAHRNGVHSIGDRVAFGSRIDDSHAVQAEVFERDAYRRRQSGGVGALALDSEEAIAAAEDQIDLCALVGSPEVGCVVRFGGQDLFDDETLPGCSSFGWPRSAFSVPTAKSWCSSPLSRT